MSIREEPIERFSGMRISRTEASWASLALPALLRYIEAVPGRSPSQKAVFYSRYFIFGRCVNSIPI